MANLRPYIDMPIGDDKKRSALLKPADGRTTAQWVGTTDTGKAIVNYPADQDNPIYTEYDSGQYAPGDIIPAIIATDQTITRVFPSDTPGEDAQWYGSTGEAIGQVQAGLGTVETKQGELDEALEAAQKELDKLPDIQEEATKAKTKADEAAAEALARGFYFGPTAPDPGDHKQWAQQVDAEPAILIMKPITSAALFERNMRARQWVDISEATGNAVYSVEVRADRAATVYLEAGYQTKTSTNQNYVQTSRALTAAQAGQWQTITTTRAASNYAFVDMGIRAYSSSAAATVEWRNPQIALANTGQVLDLDPSFSEWTVETSWVNYEPWESQILAAHEAGQRLLRWNGTEWEPLVLVAEQVLVPGSIGNIMMANGAISANNMYIDDKLWAAFIGAMNIAAQTGTLENLQVTSQAMVNELVGKILRAAEIYGAYIEGGTIKQIDGSNVTLLDKNGLSVSMGEDQKILITAGTYREDSDVKIYLEKAGGQATTLVTPTGVQITSDNNVSWSSYGVNELIYVYTGQDVYTRLAAPGVITSGYFRAENGTGGSYNATHISPVGITQRGGVTSVTNTSGVEAMRYGINSATPAQTGFMLRKTDGGADHFYAQRRGFFFDSENSANFRVANLPTTTQAANALWDVSQNRAYRVTSLRAFKALIRDQPVNMNLLNLRIRSWIDRGEADERAWAIERNGNRVDNGQIDQIETVPELRRIVGVVAEEVEELGAEEALQRDIDGNLEGVQYDRLALQYTQAVLAHSRQLEDEIKNLKAENESLRADLDTIKAHLGI